MLLLFLLLVEVAGALISIFHKSHEAHIGANIFGKTKMVLFFKDPLASHAHEVDINMLLRVCDVHNVPIATNEAASQLFLNAIALQS